VSEVKYIKGRKGKGRRVHCGLFLREKEERTIHCMQRERKKNAPPP